MARGAPKTQARAAVAAAVLGAALAASGALDAVELVTRDARFAVRGTDRERARRALVVAVDPRTLARYRDHYPLPRHLYADAARRLDRAGARAVAIDVQFSERSTRREDNALVAGLRRAPGTILAATEVGRGGTTDVLGGPDGQAYARVRVAGAFLPTDAGGTFRRFDAAQRGLPTIPLVATGLRPDRLQNGSALIDFPGPPGTVPAVSLVDLLAGRVPAGRIKGRYVVVGVTAPTVQDIHSYSALDAAQMTGAEIEADAILTAAEGAPLRIVPGWIAALLGALLAGAATVPALRLNPLRGAVALAGLLVGYAVIAQLAFGAGVVLPVAAPLMAMLLAGTACLLVAYVLEREARTLGARVQAVRAGDAARQRVERDLHDGAQQRLLALAMRLGAAPGREDDPLLRQAVGELRATVEDLRDLARGIVPPALEAEGLAGALPTLASYAGGDVRVTVDGLGRFDPEIERAAYFVAAEGLANAAKHAQAATVAVRAESAGGVLIVEVRDDGVGGAHRSGTGLRGLAERVEATGGRLELESEPGAGTTLRARLPARPPTPGNPGGAGAGADVR